MPMPSSKVENQLTAWRVSASGSITAAPVPLAAKGGQDRLSPTRAVQIAISPGDVRPQAYLKRNRLPVSYSSTAFIAIASFRLPCPPRGAGVRRDFDRPQSPDARGAMGTPRERWCNRPDELKVDKVLPMTTAVSYTHLTLPTILLV